MDPFLPLSRRVDPIRCVHSDPIRIRFRRLGEQQPRPVHGKRSFNTLEKLNLETTKFVFRKQSSKIQFIVIYSK